MPASGLPAPDVAPRAVGEGGDVANSTGWLRADECFSNSATLHGGCWSLMTCQRGREHR